MKHYKNIISGFPGAVALLDSSFLFMMVNDAFADQFHCEGVFFSAFGVDKDVFESYFARAKTTGDKVSFEWIDRQKKHLQAYEITVSYLPDEAAEYLVVVQNISSMIGNLKVLNEKTYELIQEKEQVKEIREINEKLRDFQLAIENSSHSMIITSLDGTIEFVNKGFEQNMGYSREEVVGKNSTVLQSAIPNNPVYKEITEVLKKKKTWIGELKNKRKDGSTIWEKATVSPIFNEEGKMYKFITVKEDIGKEKKILENLEASYKKLQELDKKKDEFVSVVSHELRTPLTVIQGYCSLFLDGNFGDMNENQKKYLTKILNNSQQLLGLVNDVLDLSKLEAKKMILDLKKQNFTAFLQNIHEDFALFYQEKKLSLIFDIQTAETMAFFDENKLRQVLQNLLSNAYKFTPEGKKVFLRLRLQDDDFFYCDVEDEGVGIPQDKIHTVFEKFSQVENPLQRQSEGTGLGLSIVKLLISEMKGSIVVSSEEGVGTKFTFAIPKNSVQSQQIHLDF
ncbi:hypothetical protein COB57_04410 [Candidatus Peregrinibacteria bacterium]|nr:MAG: hypothetical protein COB57_04410 [Candidatus Peregrinibacteria bacterium]